MKTKQNLWSNNFINPIQEFETSLKNLSNIIGANIIFWIIFIICQEKIVFYYEDVKANLLF